MSKYTTEVRYICENIAKQKDNTIDLYDIKKVVDLSWKDILNVDMAIELSIMPIENEFVLMHFQKIIPHILLQNYTREIGSETVGLWKFRMQNKLNSILPYYADLFETLTMKYNPLIDTDYQSIREDLRTTEENLSTNESINDTDTTAKQIAHTNDFQSEHSDSKTTTVNGENTDSGEGYVKTDKSDRYSDTPQGTVEYLEISDNMFLTNARLNNDESENEYTDTHTINTTTSENNTKTATENDTKNTSENETKTKAHQRAGNDHKTIENGGTDTTTVKGKMSSVSYSKLIKEYRGAILNINQMFFDEFKEMFMLIY